MLLSIQLHAHENRGGMFKNPFSPVFGGHPEVFFGRSELLSSFSVALADPSSEDRALFVTGTRGSGKTALVEQLIRRADEKGWHVIDLGPDHTVQTMLRSLAGYDERTTTVDPHLSVSVLGSGGSVGGRSTSKTVRLDVADLPTQFLEACERHPRGVMVAIDEVQKVPIDEVSAICNAFQLASRKGHSVILVVAGLPYAHDKVIQHEGCTYMRRAHHVELGLLSRNEAREALMTAFRFNRGLACADELLDRLLRASYGHPYMLQLLGYYLIRTINEKEHASEHVVGEGDVEETIDLAVSAYEGRSLRPLVSELTAAERGYLVATSKALDGSRMAQTAVVASILGKEPNAVSYLRDSLIRNGVLIAVGRGKLMFNIPYLAAYLQGGNMEDANLRRVIDWGV